MVTRMPCGAFTEARVDMDTSGPMNLRVGMSLLYPTNIPISRIAVGYVTRSSVVPHTLKTVIGLALIEKTPVSIKAHPWSSR